MPQHGSYSEPSVAFPGAVFASDPLPPSSRQAPSTFDQGDAFLLAVWVQLKEHLDYSKSLNDRINPAMDAALSELSPLPDRCTYDSWTEEEQEEFRLNRNEEYFTAFDRHGVTLLQREQSDLLEHVIEPLAEIMRKTVPTTLAGVAALACFMREHHLPANLWGENIDNLDLADASLRMFIDHLATLA